VSAKEAHPGLIELTVEIDGEGFPAIAYDDLTGPVAPGDVVLLNTTAVELGLGTGGAHLVIAVEGRAGGARPVTGHAMKLRYTPMQTSVDAAEDLHRDLVDRIRSLDGMPVVVAGLHSALAPAALGARAVAPGSRIAYVMTDAAALLLPFSRTVPALRDAGLLDVTVTAGQAVGGDLEAVNLHSALLVALAVGKADLVIVAMGPGNLGTGSGLGFASLEVGTIVNAVAALGGRPIVVPRISFADPRERHRGVSHHTLAALTMAALGRAEVVLPSLAPDRFARVRAQLADAGVLARHDLVEVDIGPADDVLRSSPVPLRSMGRTFEEDPDQHRAACAGGVRAADVLG